MIRCIIVDDEPLAVMQLQKYVERVSFLDCVGVCNSADEAAELLSRETVDVMFLDINMPGVNGIQFVRSLLNPPLVVFTTAYSEYALDGFKVDAVDYLLKPVGFEDFLKAANKAKTIYCGLKSMKEEPSAPQSLSYTDDSLFVKSDYRIIRVPFNSIIYVESMSEYVRIFVEDKAKPIVSLLSMKRIEEVLPADVFMRVHRSYVVNLCKIKEVSKMRIVYDGGVEVPVGDMYKDAFYDYIDRRFIGKSR